ncbi:unnamed protein product [Nezara viridula]|uniref:Uncharacterized protein n=1 Tax=Nezara viridula TaxID=85310 RepID=A0A9P0MV58_NEZVI|nr:unnamed protein product [Nezara viridula]
MADFRWQGIAEGSGSGNKGIFKRLSPMGRDIKGRATLTRRKGGTHEIALMYRRQILST